MKLVNKFICFLLRILFAIPMGMAAPMQLLKKFSVYSLRRAIGCGEPCMRRFAPRTDPHTTRIQTAEIDPGCFLAELINPHLFQIKFASIEFNPKF